MDTNALNGDAAAVAESIQAIIAETDKLESAFHQLDSMWDGPTSEVFKSVYEHDINALKSLIETLKRFNAFENGAREKYETCEADVNEIISSLNV